MVGSGPWLSLVVACAAKSDRLLTADLGANRSVEGSNPSGPAILSATFEDPRDSSLKTSDFMFSLTASESVFICQFSKVSPTTVR